MKSFLCVTFVVAFYCIVFLTNALDEPKCAEHEVLEKCNRFNVTCEKPYGDGIDTRECEPRCICEEKYIYDPKENCIPGPECKEFCNRNQTITGECIPLCPQTCPGIKLPCIPDERCIIACECREGFLLDAEGNCISREDCPKF